MNLLRKYYDAEAQGGVAALSRKTLSITFVPIEGEIQQGDFCNDSKFGLGIAVIVADELCFKTLPLVRKGSITTPISRNIEDKRPWRIQNIQHPDTLRAKIQEKESEIVATANACLRWYYKWEENQSQLAALQEENRRLREAANKVIEMNVQESIDRYGDASRAEAWACVKVLRQALLNQINNQ